MTTVKIIEQRDSQIGYNWPAGYIVQHHSGSGVFEGRIERVTHPVLPPESIHKDCFPKAGDIVQIITKEGCDQPEMYCYSNELIEDGRLQATEVYEVCEGVDCPDDCCRDEYIVKCRDGSYIQHRACETCGNNGSVDVIWNRDDNCDVLEVL